MADRRKKQGRRARSSLGRSAPSAPSGPRSSDGEPTLHLANAPLPRWLRGVVLAGAVVYLVGLFFDGVQPKTSQKLLPPSLLYFVQATCLFPRAATMAIDYRLEGWNCADRKFRELDPAPYFPVHARDKESRFHRTAHFYRKNRPVMEALEGYVLAKENAAANMQTWGGIRVSSLRIPLPDPGESVVRWTRPILTQHPTDLIKHWFYTPVSRRERKCGARAAATVETTSSASQTQEPMP